jgi:hypothetical protein
VFFLYDITFINELTESDIKINVPEPEDIPGHVEFELGGK